MTTLADRLALLPGRCSHGFDIATQHPQLCPCAGLAAKAEGQAAASSAHPDDRAAVESAIRQLAASGKPFSANEARQIHGVKGGVVGAAFSAMKNAGVIKAYESDALVRSTSGATHGHHLFQWIGVSA